MTLKSAGGSTPKSPAARTPKSAPPAKAASAGKLTKAVGANPKLAKVVKSINIKQYKMAKNGTTFCNYAFNDIAKKMGYTGMKGLVANQMFKKMSDPASGWKKINKDEAITKAKQGKLVAAGWYNNKPAKKRPDGKAPGHIAAVIGEWSKGVPGIAQAGVITKEWMSIEKTRPNPTYFVHE
jgi:hypothetical protein